MSLFLKCLLITSCFISGVVAFGQVSSSSSPSREAGGLKTKIENKKFEDTKDITDAKMRADAGSLSRFSFKFDLSYIGPAIATPLAKDQPNPDRMVRVNATHLKGSMSARYRLDSNSSLAVAGGMSALHPFHGVERFNMNTPQLVYDMFHRLGGAQMRNAFGVSVETVPTFLDVGMAGGLNYVSSMVYDLGTSGFAFGTDAMFFYKVYNREYQASDRSVPRYTLILSPNLKYNFSDRLSVNSNLGFSFWNPRFLANDTALWPQTVTQKLGLGYAFSKTVYVSPYLNMYPAKLAWDTTTVNISTVFSVL